MSRTKAEKKALKAAQAKAARPDPLPFPPIPEVTPEDAKMAVQLLRNLVYDAGCSFSMSRKFEGGTCGQENGRGFDCFYCSGRYFLRRIGALREEDPR